MEFLKVDGEQRWAALVRAAAETVVALDFDGTLAPIVDDPARAHIHPDAGAALVGLSVQVAGVAVVTGRPARQVLDLGGLEEVGDAIAAQGKDLHVFGQYGNERWSSVDRRVVGPRPPAGLASFERELPGILRRLDAVGAFVEDKGLAVAVHTRRLPDAEGVFARLLPAVTDSARRHGLVVEPGKAVIEVRSGGVHKGLAVSALVKLFDAGGFLFCGDDLGDLEAFEAVRALADAGMPTLLACSSGADGEPPPGLLPLADVVVPGPTGVVEMLRRFADEASLTRA